MSIDIHRGTLIMRLGQQPPARFRAQAGARAGDLSGLLLDDGTGVQADYRFTDIYLDHTAGRWGRELIPSRSIRLETYWCYEPGLPMPAVDLRYPRWSRGR